MDCKTKIRNSTQETRISNQNENVNLNRLLEHVGILSKKHVCNWQTCRFSHIWMDGWLATNPPINAALVAAIWNVCIYIIIYIHIMCIKIQIYDNQYNLARLQHKKSRYIWSTYAYDWSPVGCFPQRQESHVSLIWMGLRMGYTHRIIILRRQLYKQLDFVVSYFQSNLHQQVKCLANNCQRTLMSVPKLRYSCDQFSWYHQTMKIGRDGSTKDIPSDFGEWFWGRLDDDW